MTEPESDDSSSSTNPSPGGRAARSGAGAESSRRRVRMPIGGPLSMVRRWQDYRERQLELLAESNQLRRERLGPGEGAAAATSGRTAPPASATPASGIADSEPEMTMAARRAAGVHLSSPFYIGFVGALGVLTAVLLAGSVARLSTVWTVLLVSIFLALVLNPVVEMLLRRGLPRPLGVTLVFVGLLGLLALLGFLVIPPIVSETSTLLERAPRYVEELGDREWFAELDAEYEISERLQAELNSRLSDTNFISTIFGGVLGAFGWLATSVVSVFSTLILTLYFLAALPAVKDSAYKLVPASRRPRVVSLAEETMRRVSGYAIGQTFVATINGTCAWIVMEILSIPYAVVLAVAVGVLGLIPMVGATLGAGIVALVALFQAPQLALVVVIYFLIYQQVENYVIVPRVMHRTVSVPGAVTVVAVFAGGTLLGVLGALIAIPVAAGLLLLYEEVVVPRQAKL